MFVDMTILFLSKNQHDSFRKSIQSSRRNTLKSIDDLAKPGDLTLIRPFAKSRHYETNVAQS